MTESAIQIEHLTKRFGSVNAIDNMNLDVEQTEIFGLLGPNGAGKSTAISIILGVKQPTSGSVRVFGLDSTKQARQIRALTGYVMQQVAHDRFLSGRENCTMHAGLFGLKGRERIQRVNEVLEWAGLLEASDRIVNSYSGGMMRRLDLAISMLHEPRLIVLDEPTLGLDIETRRRLWAMIGRMRERGATILLTTHYLEEASQLCDRVAIMHQGRLAALGTPDELKQCVSSGRHSLQIALANPDAINGIDLPPGARIHDATLSLSAPPEQLWRFLGRLQHQAPAAIRSVSYQEPTLDDVFLELTGAEVTA